MTPIRLFLLAAALLAGASAAEAQERRPVLNHVSVMTILNTCAAWAEERDLSLSIAVVDDATQLRGFVTMDGALFATRDIARRKAYTAAAANQPTSEAGWLAQLPGVAEGGAYVPLRGGVPLRTGDGSLIGAVGVSGAPAEVDEQCAIAAVEAAGLEHGVEDSEAD